MGSAVTILGPAYTGNLEQYQWLLKTAAKFGAPTPQLFGLGRPHPGDPQVLEDAISALKTCGTRYALCTDTYDTMFLRWDESELIKQIEKSKGLLLATEMECWPPGEWCAAYKGGPAINGGQSCGLTEYLIFMFQEMQRVPVDNCQERLHRMYAMGYPMGLDTERAIFYTMSGGMAQWLSKYNPMMVHGNGRSADMGALARSFGWE